MGRACNTHRSSAETHKKVCSEHLGGSHSVQDLGVDENTESQWILEK
jgi:hypothetical protein